MNIENLIILLIYLKWTFLSCISFKVKNLFRHITLLLFIQVWGSLSLHKILVRLLKEYPWKNQLKLKKFISAKKIYLCSLILDFASWNFKEGIEGLIRLYVHSCSYDLIRLRSLN